MRVIVRWTHFNSKGPIQRERMAVGDHGGPNFNSKGPIQSFTFSEDGEPCA